MSADWLYKFWQSKVKSKVFLKGRREFRRETLPYSKAVHIVLCETMANLYVCIYFKSDKSFSVILKNRCSLGGAFILKLEKKLKLLREDRGPASKHTSAKL